MRRPAPRHLAPALFLLFFSGVASAADCSGDPRVRQLYDAQVGATALQDFKAPATVADALCLRTALLRLLRQEAGLGQSVGYKVGLTAQAMQDKLGIAHPLWGVLLAGMLLPDGASISPRYAARPLVEADLLVTVADSAINHAKTSAEVARYLADLKPFIELADLTLAAGQPIDEATLVAINVGARYGVMGDSLPMTAEIAAALPGMTVTLTGPDGVMLTATGSALLGDPLQAVIWLAQALKSQGKALKPGDVISLGSFGPAQAPVAGGTFAASYVGLPGGDLKVRVTFKSE